MESYHYWQHENLGKMELLMELEFAWMPENSMQR